MQRVWVVEYDSEYGVAIHVCVSEKAALECREEIAHDNRKAWDVPPCLSDAEAADRWSELTGNNEFFRTNVVEVREERDGAGRSNKTDLRALV